jgi:anti-sigma factor (TIGR02949 family)
MCDCDECEEMMQPYMDGSLSDEKVAEAEEHLADCSWCAKRYRFEEKLRHYVRVAASEEMPLELKAKLAALRPPLICRSAGRARAG